MALNINSCKVLSLVVVFLVAAVRHTCSLSLAAGGGVTRSHKVKVQDYRKVLEHNGLSNWLVFERRDAQQGITHTEFYRRRVVHKLSRVPLLGRFFKPLAKVGIRTRSVPGQGNLEDFIRSQFNDQEQDIGLKLGLLVYMWVAPRWRGLNLGEMLLSLAVEQCQNKGDKYMLCVHDDAGSGKLVEWYRKRCFYAVPDDIVEKGLVGSLFSPPAAEITQVEGDENVEGEDKQQITPDSEEE